MAIEPGGNISAADYINESERASDRTQDEGRVPKIEQNGHISQRFLKIPNIITYSNNGSYTYTKPSNLAYIEVEVVGAGGGGGSGHNGTSGGGGASGGYAKKIIHNDDLPTSVNVSVGKGGDGNADQDGQPGEGTNFGNFLSASGGGGGDERRVSSRQAGIGSGGDINARGNAGNYISGGGSFFGGGAHVRSDYDSSGLKGENGGGGSGGINGGSIEVGGGKGGDGVVVIKEYI